MLVGVAPQTRHFWTKCPEVMAASPALSRLFLIPAGGRDPQQMINVRLNSQGLPHIPPGRVVLDIEGLFLRRQIFICVESTRAELGRDIETYRLPRNRPRKGLKQVGFQGPNSPRSVSKCYALKFKTGASHKIPSSAKPGAQSLETSGFFRLKGNRPAPGFMCVSVPNTPTF